MTLEHEPTDEELLAIYSTAEGDSSYDGWRALWRAGAEWVSQRDPSPEEIEAVAHVLHEEFCMTRVYEGQGDDERVVGITPWDWLGDESRERYRTAARAALEAVEALEEVETP